ncbi:hypothetical protein ABZT04_33430 [Streptomyces sp. NPDC005492]|uniref:hypothetical protein n=1 Tax=Streptomyces sp. NPDC005492 TaxID=3156883 RepID=UPI0033B3D3C6
MSTTAAAAARHAATWAERAENHHKAAGSRREKAHEMASQRYSASARDWHERADSSEEQRDTAVAMANMWVGVSRVLHLVEDGEPS